MIRLLKIFTALLPLWLFSVIGFVLYSNIISNWYAVLLAIGLLPTTYCCWYLTGFSSRLSRLGAEYSRLSRWDQLRLMCLASLSCVALTHLVFTVSFKDVRAPITAAQIALHVSGEHMATYLLGREFDDCVASGGSESDCQLCLSEALGEFATQPAIDARFGTASVSSTTPYCFTKRLRVDGLSPLACSFVMAWVDTGWLSRVAIAEHDAITDKFNRDYISLCHQSADPISINLDYTYPPVRSLGGKAP